MRRLDSLRYIFIRRLDSLRYVLTRKPNRLRWVYQKIMLSTSVIANTITPRIAGR